MTWTITCAQCGAVISTHFELFSHVHPPMPAMTEEEQREAKRLARAFSMLRTSINQRKFNHMRQQKYGQRRI